MKLQSIAAAMLAACLPLSVQAANWVDVLATEPADARAIKPFGFVQPTYTYFDADPLSGMGGAAVSANGQYQIQNQVGPTFENTDQLQFLRAQFGLRGRLTDKINYFLLTDVGHNLTTVQHPLMVTDASMTFSSYRARKSAPACSSCPPAKRRWSAAG